MRFITAHDIPADLHELSRAELHWVARSFVYWLRHATLSGAHRKASTISQYVSHVIFHLKLLDYPDAMDIMRPPQVKMMLTGYDADDGAAVPERLRVKIPLTLAIVLAALAIIDELYPPSREPARNAGLKAALCLGLGLALRPGEYLHETLTRPSPHEALAQKAFFTFRGPHVDPHTPYPVTDPERYPRDPTRPSGLCMPHMLVLFLEHTKNDRVGHGGPRVLAQAPPNAQFSLLDVVFECLRAFPPPRTGNVFDGIMPALTVKILRDVLKVVAIRNGLDPARVVPHGFRAGAIFQTDGASPEDQLALGRWHNLEGKRPYDRIAFQQAFRIAPLMNDPSITTLADLVFLFMPESVPTA
jgi:integrase